MQEFKARVSADSLKTMAADGGKAVVSVMGINQIQELRVAGETNSMLLDTTVEGN